MSFDSCRISKDKLPPPKMYPSDLQLSIYKALYKMMIEKPSPSPDWEGNSCYIPWNEASEFTPEKQVVGKRSFPSWDLAYFPGLLLLVWGWVIEGYQAKTQSLAANIPVNICEKNGLEFWIFFPLNITLPKTNMTLEKPHHLWRCISFKKMVMFHCHVS